MTFLRNYSAIKLPLRTGIHMVMSALLVTSIAACGSDSSVDESPVNNDPEQSEAPDSGDDNNGAEPRQDVPGNTSSSVIGDVLSFGDDSRSLYIFLNDSLGVSNCNEACASNWPAAQADFEQTAGNYYTIEREDGSLQWSFNGQALYYYVGDAAEGDVSGEGIGEVWYVARDVPISRVSSSLGEILAAKGSTVTATGDTTVRNEYHGRTLYVFSNDTENDSNCNEGCATNWPPLYVDTAPLIGNDYSVVTRDDGSLQWAYKTQPLYFYAGDSAAGDTTGEGLGDVWFAARP